LYLIVKMFADLWVGASLAISVFSPVQVRLLEAVVAGL